MESLGELVAQARAAGWASGAGDIYRLAADAEEMGWKPLGQRLGQGPVVELKPTAAADAPPRSLSALVGRAAQPLHTDGAHLPVCPDVIVLACPAGSPTSTMLWRPIDASAGRSLVPEFLGSGLFLVDAGSSPFFAPAFEPGQLRYDPGCMSPCDARAREAAAFLTPDAGQLVEHHWDEPGQVLVIDNRRVPHGRGDATQDSNRAMLRSGFAIREAS